MSNTARLSALFPLARELKNNTQHALSYLRELENNNPAEKAFAEKALPGALASILRDAEAIAAEVPVLRQVASGADTPAEVKDLGLAVIVRFRPPTNSGPAKWLATFWRDRELTFRASHQFTYDDKDNDGADLAAAKCLAKFTAYANSGETFEDLPKVVFRISGRASLGNGLFAYTFKRFNA